MEVEVIEAQTRDERLLDPLDTLDTLHALDSMILRLWHGWTTPANAAAYERLLLQEVIPGIAAKGVAGYRGIQVSRRPLHDEIEFITIMRFESLEAVKKFAGEDYERAYVPPRAREMLSRFDDRSQHYEVREEIEY